MIQKLITLEWMKIRSHKAFWIMLSLFGLGFFGLVYIVYDIIKHEISGQMVGSFLSSNFRYPQVARLTAFMGSFTLMVLGGIINTLIANEINFRTHRQNIIDGVSRTQFINAKWCDAIILAVFAGLVHILLTAVFAFVGDGGTIAGFVHSLTYSFYFTLDALMWVSVALILSLWVKRAGLAISIFIVYSFVAENVITFFLKQMAGLNLGEYLPINIVDGLCPNTLLSFVNTGSRPPDTAAVAIGCVYIIGLYILSRRMIEKMDLK